MNFSVKCNRCCVESNFHHSINRSPKSKLTCLEYRRPRGGLLRSCSPNDGRSRSTCRAARSQRGRRRWGRGSEQRSRSMSKAQSRERNLELRQSSYSRLFWISIEIAITAPAFKQGGDIIKEALQNITCCEQPSMLKISILSF